MSFIKCSIEGCDTRRYARGWCGKHYARWRKHGDPHESQYDVQPRPADGLCTIDGCDRAYYYSGVCSGHYSRRMRDGADASDGPLESRFYDPEMAFAAQVHRVGDCIEWIGRLTDQGYGVFKSGGKQVSSHRYAWTRESGAIPDGMQIDHACHNRACVNVDHLRLATQPENVRNLSGPTANNKHSGARNVGKMGDRWRVRITKDGTTHALGCYETIEQARVVAEAGRAKLFGQFAGKG